MGMLGLVLVVLVVGSALLAPWIAPYPPTKIMVMDKLQGPSWDHLLGTDQLGRDLLSRVLYGGRVALWIAFASTVLSLAGGLVLGMLAAFGPRWLDSILVLLFDALRSFPTIMFGLAAITLLGPSIGTLMLIIIVFTTPAYARVVRTQALSLRSAEFIEAERSMGIGFGRMLLIHVLPNVISPLLIIGSMDLPAVIAFEAGLSFIGLGVRPPASSWGSILNDGYGFIRESNWMIIAPGVPLVAATLGFTFLGEAMRDFLDPRLRKVR
jgi:peptide/nickel transport system permease protein